MKEEIITLLMLGSILLLWLVYERRGIWKYIKAYLCPRTPKVGETFRFDDRTTSNPFSEDGPIIIYTVTAVCRGWVQYQIGSWNSKDSTTIRAFNLYYYRVNKKSALLQLLEASQEALETIESEFPAVEMPACRDRLRAAITKITTGLAILFVAFQLSAAPANPKVPILKLAWTYTPATNAPPVVFEVWHNTNTVVNAGAHWEIDTNDLLNPKLTLVPDPWKVTTNWFLLAVVTNTPGNSNKFLMVSNIWPAEFIIVRAVDANNRTNVSDWGKAGFQ